MAISTRNRKRKAKNPAAVRLAARRSAKLSAARRKEIAQQAARSRWRGGKPAVAGATAEGHGVGDSLRREIVRRVLTVANPDRVILFGSAAAGRMTRDSDIDLLIVEPAPPNRTEESVKIRRALGDLGYSIDVIVISTGRFEETRDIFGGIAYPAHKYGTVLYASGG